MPATAERPTRRVIVELKRIAAAGDGFLRAGDIVEAAKDRRSPLHSHFEWDDTAAGHKWRLHQARLLIIATVEYLRPDRPETFTRAFVSLRKDRSQIGGGYRLTAAVLTDSQLREQMLDDALAELVYFEQKYRHLEELAEIFHAIRNVTRKLPTKRGRKRPTRK